MNPGLRKADAFRDDFALRALRYVREAGEAIARRFERAVDTTLRRLCAQPDLGRARRFRHQKLQGLRSFPVERRPATSGRRDHLLEMSYVFSTVSVCLTLCHLGILRCAADSCSLRSADGPTRA